jgi:hypothetical protein
MFVMYANELDTPAPLSGRPLDRREKRWVSCTKRRMNWGRLPMDFR